MRRCDKYRELPAGPYDWIVDNNPTSYACCRRHARLFLDRCAAALAPGGRFVSDRQGLRYAWGDGFGLGWVGFWINGRRRGLLVRRQTESVWTWQRPG